MSSFTKKEKIFLQKLNTPSKVQDFLNSLKFNFEKRGETLKSPLNTIKEKNAHCFEGALLGAYILSLHGFKPYILLLRSTKEDYDHVIVPFQVNGFWGALSKTNHAVLRYREPIYKNIRELVLSYFHEYFLDNGKKTLRKYSGLLSLNKLKKPASLKGGDWATQNGNLWYIYRKLYKMKTYNIVPKAMIKKLRKAEKVEIRAGKVVEYKK